MRQLVGELNALLNISPNNSTGGSNLDCAGLVSNYQRKIDELKNNGFFMGTFDQGEMGLLNQTSFQ